MMLRGALFAAAVLVAGPAFAAPTLAPAWSDHIVIQRDKPIVVEGTGAAGASLKVTLGSQSSTGKVGANGHFSVKLAPLTASADPIALTVSDGSGETKISDILVGDVWLCSGQSNMELPMYRSLDQANQIAASADDGLRLLTIPKETAPGPATAFATPVAWTKASPDTVRDFSAACFYMAQKLRRDLKIPIGAIHSSWGGSQIRAWLTPEGGLALYGREQMALLTESQADLLKAVTSFAPTYQDWWRSSTGGQEPWAKPATLTWKPAPSISPFTSWKAADIPADGIGNILFRRVVTLTPEQAKAGGTLNIGIIDDLDMTFVNGHAVGNTHGWSNERHYPVPASFLKPGANEVLVIANNTYGGGGMQSTADRISFAVTGGATVPLADGWQYSVGAVRGAPPRAPWDANAGIGVMHNKMIAPLGPVALKGAAWYQGESDVGIPGYADRLKQLFAGWRRQFGPLQVLVIQLPNYGPLADRPGESGWAALREEQRKAVMADQDAALIATLDVGDAADLHPPNKNEIGRRMARAAEGQALPMPASAVREGGAIRVDFTGVEGSLHAWSGPPLGVELCGEMQDSCRYAQATASGTSLTIADDGRPATRVRYAWSEAPVVNLTDGRALPVPGFELPIGQ